MAVTKYSPEDIIPIVIHILSFSTVKFAEYGYRSIVEYELTDLKDLDADEISPVLYFQLIEASDDELSKAISKCITHIDTSIDTLRIMHAIELDELYTDERIHELSNQLYADLYYHTEGLIHDEVSAAVMELPYTAANAFFHLCKLIIHQEIDVDMVMDEDFYGTGQEEFEFMDLSNPNVAVIHELTQQILKLNMEIYAIYVNKDADLNSKKP